MAKTIVILGASYAGLGIAHKYGYLDDSDDFSDTSIGF